MINLRYLIIILFTLIAVPLTVVAADQEKDTIASRLLQEVRITFNQNDEQRFYDASSAYRNHLLQKGNRPGYYLSWKNEILYDVNHNHFYRALRKTMKMQGEMEERGDKEEFYKYHRAYRRRDSRHLQQGEHPLYRQDRSGQLQ